MIIISSSLINNECFDRGETDRIRDVREEEAGNFSAGGEMLRSCFVPLHPSRMPAERWRSSVGAAPPFAGR